MSARTAVAARIEDTGREYTILEREVWLCRRLLLHDVNALAGVTDQAQRKANFRAAIRDNSLDVVIAGNTKDGKPITYAAAFEKLYGEKL